MKRIKSLTFVICGVTVSFGGILLSSKLNSGSSVYGETTALTMISAVVVGGASLAGGIGGALNTMIGLLVLAVMETFMNMLNIDPYLQVILRGVMIVMILCLDSYSRKRVRETV